MSNRLPAPIVVPWTMKPVSSAVATIDTLDDGRLRCHIVHDVIQGVTPRMLHWWFCNMAGDMLVEGRSYPRYRVWHPLDHVAHAYVRQPPGGVGPGSVFRIHEVLQRNPAWRIDVLTRVTQLDETGFAHRPRPHGLPVVRMDYTFTRCAGGTRYVNTLTFGVPARGAARCATRPLNALLRAAAFPLDKARAWIRHNVEEVGNFEFFLPQLFREQSGTGAADAGQKPTPASLGGKTTPLS